MSNNQNDKRVVQLINSGKFNDDWDELEEYCEEHGMRPNMTYGKAKEPKRTYLDEYMDEPKR
jgi:hypothetical protein